jgi:hypothetical protein
MGYIELFRRWKLLRRWKSTRWHLEKACQLLPSHRVENAGDIPDEDLATLAAFQEFLDHNELELALEQLEGVGELNKCPSGFWQNLERAARIMGLEERAASLRRRWENPLGA